jgi:tetratricopeptide (TPR) repeat protein
VVTLHKTKNKMPRWLSEGISVFEERQADATWGQTMTPRYRELVLEGSLTPVSQLSGAFLNPPSPAHLEFAYFESAMVVEYLVQQFGHEALEKILVELAGGASMNESLAKHAGSLESLDRQFAEFAKNKALNLAPGVDWRRPDLPENTDAKVWETWTKANPKSFWGLHRFAQRLIRDQEWQAAKSPLRQLVQLYPEYVKADNAYALLARVHRELGESDAERAMLAELVARSSDAQPAFLRMTELCAAAKDGAGVIRNAEKALAVNPLLPAPHRFLAAEAEQLGEDARAIESLQALLEMDPLDPAELHYRLACLLDRAGQAQAARRHVLRSLEEAPRFRAAHAKLLDIVGRPDAKPQESKP